MSQTAEPVSPEHLQAIGLITVNFASLENWISMIIWQLISDDQRLGQIITAELSYRNQLALLSSVFLHRAPDAEQQTELERLVSRALKIEQERNIIVHSWWGSGDSPQTITRLKTTAKISKGLRHQFVRMTVADLNTIADDIEQLTIDVRSFFHKL